MRRGNVRVDVVRLSFGVNADRGDDRHDSVCEEQVRKAVFTS